MSLAQVYAEMHRIVSIQLVLILGSGLLLATAFVLSLAWRSKFAYVFSGIPFVLTWMNAPIYMLPHFQVQIVAFYTGFGFKAAHYLLFSSIILSILLVALLYTAVFFFGWCRARNKIKGIPPPIR